MLKDSGFKVAYSKEPVYLPRACKTAEEQQAMRDAHIRDGVAMVKFLKWIEENQSTSDENISIHIELNKLRDLFIFEATTKIIDNARLNFYMEAIKQMQDSNIKYWKRAIKNL